jgi:hypothetical protein
MAVRDLVLPPSELLAEVSARDLHVDPLLRALVEPPRPGARHCVRSLACVTGSACACACAICGQGQ